MITRFYLAIRAATVSVEVVAVVAGKGESNAVSAVLDAAFAESVEGVAWSALSAFVASSAGGATIGARETLLFLIVPESSYLAATVVGSVWSFAVGRQGSSVLPALTFELIVSSFALTLTVSPFRVGLHVALIASAVHDETFALARGTFFEETWHARAAVGFPGAVFNFLAAG